MTDPSSQRTEREERGLPRLIACALACSLAHFPPPDGGSVDAAHFLLSGKYDLWPGYRELPFDDQRRLARLLRHRHNALADKAVFQDRVADQFAQDRVPGMRLEPDGRHVRFHHGVAPREFADRLLDELDRVAEEAFRPQPIAKVGEHTHNLQVPMAGGLTTPALATYTFLAEHVPAHRPPAAVLRTSPDLPHVALDIQGFLALNRTLDKETGSAYREGALGPFFSRMRDRSGRAVGEELVLRAGDIQVFSAPTGSGKSVMMAGIAAWAVQQGHTLALVVSTNADVLKLTRQIEEELVAADLLKGSRSTPEQVVVPLMSPDGLVRELERTIRNSTDTAYVDWVFERLGYSCQLPVLAAVDDEVDAWTPGGEPCRRLAPVRPPRQNEYRTMPEPKVCPFRHKCGKFRLTRAATTASVLVTTHSNLHAGNVHIPLESEDGLVSEHVSVEEFVLRRCQIVLIDELDAFQSTVFERNGRNLVLAWGDRPHDRPLIELDNQLVAAFHRLPAALEERARKNVSESRALAETYTMHLARGDLGQTDRLSEGTASRPNRRRRGDAARRWIVPTKWDSWLAAKLAPFLDNDPQQIGAAEPVRTGISHTFTLETVWDPAIDTHLLPDHLQSFAGILRSVTSKQHEAGSLDHARDRLDGLLRTWVPAPKTRLDVVDRLVRRMFLVPLRDLLHRFVYDAPQLKLAGVAAAEEIASALGGYDHWRAVPHGPLGRQVFAFTEDVNPLAPQDTRLSAVAFGGDPHRYLLDLGQNTALAHSGHRRIVLGLSATAYVPGAHRHYVHTRPTYVVPDDGEPIEVDLRPVPGIGSEELLRISGLSGTKRREATHELGAKLWSELKRELDQLASAGNPVGIQDAILLATTSYISCLDLADGLTSAGAPPGLVVVAVRPDPERVADAEGPYRPWTEIPADRLEDFGAMAGARILVAPLQRAERSLNILSPGERRSRVGAIWLAVRPMSIVDEPSELLAHIGARTFDEHRPHDLPWKALEGAEQTASGYFNELLASERYFRALPSRAKIAVAAELVASLTQLVGRARRGGTPGRLRLVDAAFIDTSGNSDLPSILRALRSKWIASGEFDTVVNTNRAALEGFFTFADQQHRRRSNLDTEC
ncbi:hypothetical protein [Kitasatospora sp. NPDC087271]|uniref:hypothetical protein n=1 Tax=Kitasatospora sp. NPDC087271 TaxID=3364067 RepID=UPI0037FECC81